MTSSNAGLEALLPCPFCGGKAEQYHRDDSTGWSNTDWICCTNEDCGCGTCLHETVGDAIAAWNRRAPDTASQARVKVLEEAMEAKDRALFNLHEAVDTEIDIGAQSSAFRKRIVAARQSLAQTKELLK